MVSLAAWKRIAPCKVRGQNLILSPHIQGDATTLSDCENKIDFIMKDGAIYMDTR